MVGRTVAHYQLTEKLGAGGMGEIYRAQDTRLSRTVAIKALPDSHTGDPERRRRFLQEARAASALNHPNIITIHDVVFEGETAYMVMEFVGGETLGEKIAAGPMNATDVVNYGLQIADALAAAHDAGIVHRDLKPGNVMITPRGLAKVLDFGLAKRSLFAASAVSLSDATATVGSAPLTVEGSILGTVSYMSPEQAEGRTVDGRSDIFSFGVVLYEMLTGHRPFTGDSTLSILSSILRDDARQLTHHVPHVPRPMDEIVRRCLAKRPEERWQNMHELRDALAAAKSMPAAPPPKPQRFPTLAVAAVGGAFLVGAIVWFMIGSKKPEPPSAAPSPAPIASVAPADVLTNDHVLSMLRAKVAAPVIVEQIRSSRTNFDLSVPAVIRLTEAGAGGDLIEIMRDPKRPFPAASKPSTTAAVPTPSSSAPATLPPAPIAPPPPSAPAPTPSAGALAVTIPDAYPFKIELAEDVPADAEPGRPIHFTVSEELRIGPNVVLPVHSDVLGEIVDGAKKKLIGGTKLTFRLKTASVRGGGVLNLRVTPSGRDTRRPVENTAGPKPPKNLAAVIGTGYVAYTAGQQVVQLPK